MAENPRVRRGVDVLSEEKDLEQRVGKPIRIANINETAHL
jgi:hypothetical protein